VHIPYTIAGQVKTRTATATPDEEPIVPHGMAAALTAPEAFRFTFEAGPDRHVRAAALLDPGFDRSGDPAECLPSVLVGSGVFMEATWAGKMRCRIFLPDQSEVTFERRGFTAPDAARRANLEKVGSKSQPKMRRSRLLSSRYAIPSCVLAYTSNSRGG
jgi:hypothetical protein